MSLNEDDKPCVCGKCQKSCTTDFRNLSADTGEYREPCSQSKQAENTQ